LDDFWFLSSTGGGLFYCVLLFQATQCKCLKQYHNPQPTNSLKAPTTATVIGAFRLEIVLLIPGSDE